MASQQIFEGTVRTELGTCALRIYDTDTDNTTPNLWSGDVLGGINLEYGDNGQSGDGLPIGAFGSFFDLQFVDNPANEFRTIFNENFSRLRYRVELEFPTTSQLETWYGWVQPDIQQRPLTGRTRKEAVSVTCADGIGALQDEPPLNDAFQLSVEDFLLEALGMAVPNLDVAYWFDISGNRVNTTDTPVSENQLVPNEDPLGQFAPISGEYQGLKGGSVREQLSNLAKTYHAAIYQDLRVPCFAAVDVAALGLPVQWVRYDRSANSAIQEDAPDGRIDLLEPRDESEDVLEPVTSVRKVCAPVDNWSVDPKMEQASSIPSTTGLYYVNQDGAEIQYTNNQTETELEIGATTYPEFAAFIGVDMKYIDAVRLSTQGDNPGVALRAIYGDGTSDTKNVITEPLTLDLDQNKDSLREVTWEFSAGTTVYIKSHKLQLLQSEQVVQPDGSTKTEYQRTETICFVDDGEGRTVRDTNNFNILTRLGNGSRASSDGYFSMRYQNVGNLARWRAINLLALLKPGIEKLRNVALGQWLPFGTRVQWAKPGESAKTDFVPQTGRVLKVGSEVSAGTELNDVEIADEVTRLVLETAVEAAQSTISLTPSVTETVS